GFQDKTELKKDSKPGSPTLVPIDLQIALEGEKPADDASIELKGLEGCPQARAKKEVKSDGTATFRSGPICLVELKIFLSANLDEGSVEVDTVKYRDKAVRIMMKRLEKAKILN